MPINTSPTPLSSSGPKGSTDGDLAFRRPAGGANPAVGEAVGPSPGRPLKDPPMSGESTRLEAGVKSPVAGFSAADIKRGYSQGGSLTSAAKSDGMEPA